MDIRLPRENVGNPLEALRKAGYSPFRDPKSGEHSFVCRLGADFYPRFHLYLHEDARWTTFSLHLDQKKASYAGSHMHNGEYEGAHIEKEIERIRGWILHVHQEAQQLQSSHDFDAPKAAASKKPWWKIW